MKKRIKKITIILSCTIAIALFGLFIYDFFFYAVGEHHPDFCSFDVLPLANYERIIEERGEPHAREIIERNDRPNIYALHYDEVIFYMMSMGLHKNVMYYDIIGESYRLGGFAFRSIGVGSTRSAVVNDFHRRSHRHNIWRERPCGLGLLNSSFSLENAGFGFYHSGTGHFIEFKFDENDIVIRMRVGWMM